MLKSLQTFLDRIVARNLPGWRVVRSPRSMTWSVSLMRRKAARFIEWFQSVTRVLFGELSFPLEQLVFFHSPTGHGTRTRKRPIR